jgi:hypothetical protein
MEAITNKAKGSCPVDIKYVNSNYVLMSHKRNEFIYCVRLSSGIIATKPEDFPDDEYEIEVDEEIED